MLTWLLTHQWALTGLLIAVAAFVGFVIGGHRPRHSQNEGEAIVRQAILATLPGPTWHLLNNVTLRTPDGTTQVDHILISRYGIFVIETKHYRGWIFGDAKSKQWTQVIYRRKSRFQNPIHQNYKHVKTVQALLEFLPLNHVQSIVVFSGKAEFKINKPDGVFSVTELIAYLKTFDVEVLTENRQQFCVGRLECHRLALTLETDVEHQINLHRRFEDAT